MQMKLKFMIDLKKILAATFVLISVAMFAQPQGDESNVIDDVIAVVR